MMFEDYYSLEFCGGPYDGYSQQVSIPHANLLEMVSLPVNRNVLRVIQGESPGPDSPTKSVAIYELRENEPPTGKPPVRPAATFISISARALVSP